MSIGIYLPVYNDQQALKQNIPKVDAFLKKKKIIAQLYVIDDGSTDNTSQVVKLLAKKYKITYVHYSNGPSRRENLGKALSESKHEILVYMDIDLATGLDALPRMLEGIKKYDIVIGSRYAKDAHIQRTVKRFFISKIYNRAIQILLKSSVRDHQCGCKCIHKDAFQKIYRYLGYDTTLTRGWFWDAEMLIIAQRLGLTIKEIPVSWIEGKKSSFSIQREMRMIRYILQKLFQLRKMED